MEWVHRTDPEWIKARSKYLTASDVKKLLPTTATGRKRSNVDEAYFEVWASKQFLDVLDEMTVSTGMAARGHVLEPYAVNELNHIGETPFFYHWDDQVVHDGVLGWSPDGIDFPQQSKAVEYEAFKILSCNGLEIKSYGIEKHMSKIAGDPMQLEERWQLATAMAVVDDLETMTLAFFNPNCRKQIGWFTYDRGDLSKEIVQVLEIREKWMDMVESFMANPVFKNKRWPLTNELDIREQYVQERDSVINPD